MPSTTSRSARPPRRRHPRRAEGHPTDALPRLVQHAPAASPNPAAAPSAATHPVLPSLDDATDFGALGVAANLVAALAAQGIEQPFPIQCASLPASLSGRDVLARGRTGSGKTVAFALPVISRLAATPAGSGRARRPRALVLVPTRELATQVAATFQPLAKAAGLRVTTVFGGVSQVRQERALAEGVDVLIACPGRLDDLVNQGVCPLDRVEITVLDEADHLADLGFLPTVRRLMDRTPGDGQRLLFSATLDAQVDAVVRRYLHDPVRCNADPETANPARIDHHVLSVTADDKAGVITTLASGVGPTLLFTRTKHSARKLAKRLSRSGIAAVDLHGDLAQSARDRNMAAFRAGTARVLVATDIAARGIHVDGIALVVHVDPPAEPKAFAHRSGRTARAGSDGIVVTLATPDQRHDVDKLTRQAGIKPTYTSVAPGHPLLAELRGEEAELLEVLPELPPSTVNQNTAAARTKRPGTRRRHLR